MMVCENYLVKIMQIIYFALSVFRAELSFQALIQRNVICPLFNISYPIIHCDGAS